MRMLATLGDAASPCRLLYQALARMREPFDDDRAQIGGADKQRAEQVEDRCRRDALSADTEAQAARWLLRKERRARCTVRAREGRAIIGLASVELPKEERGKDEDLRAEVGVGGGRGGSKAGVVHACSVASVEPITSITSATFGTKIETVVVTAT